MRMSVRSLIAGILTIFLVIAAVAYFAVLPGLSVARQEPSKLEVAVATYLLQHSVPSSAKAMPNPLGAHPDPAAIAAGPAIQPKVRRLSRL